MTLKKDVQNYGPPPPITQLTYEQDLKLRNIHDALVKPETQKKDIITVFMALQRQNYILANSMINLVKSWPPPPPTQTDLPTTNEDLSMFGILLETRN